MRNHSKFFSFFIFAAFLSLYSFGQDIIYTKDGAKIEAKILEERTYQVRYLKFSKPNGPVYLIDKSDIEKLVYESGENVVFTEVTNDVVQSNVVQSNIKYAENIVWYHLFDIVYHDFTLSYEKIIKDGTIGIQIPVGLGFGPNEFDYSNSYNLAYTGIGLNLYPLGQERVCYYLGPVIHIGHGKAYKPGHTWNEDETVEFSYGKLLINNGMIFSPTNNYSISTVFSLGVKYLDTETSWIPAGITRSAWFSIKMGYRF